MTNCPDCNSLQRFATHKREVADRIEIYTECRACGYELVLHRLTHQEYLELRRDRVRLLRALRRRVRL